MNSLPDTSYFNRQLEWCAIAQTLTDSQSYERVTFTEQNDRLFVKSKTNLLDWVPTFILVILPSLFRRCGFESASTYVSNYISENQAAVRYLYKSFGEERVKHLFKRWDVDLNYVEMNGISLSQEDIKNLFVHLAHVHIQDLQGVFRQVTTANGSCLHLSPSEVASIQARFYGKRFDDLTAPEIRELYDIAVPFRNIETIFLNKPPVGYIRSGHDKGESIWEIALVVWFMECRRRGRFTDQFDRHAGRVDEYYNMKQVIGPKTSKGLVIPGGDGYRYVWKQKSLGGMTRQVWLKTLAACGREGLCENEVAFLPTQFRSSVPYKWPSWYEDLTVDMGSEAVIAGYRDFRSRITDPSRGFVDRVGQKVRLCGYSLGAAQMQRYVAALLPDQCISKATAINSPGVDRGTAEFYARNSHRFTQAPTLEYLTNLGDAVSCLGDRMLGHGCEMARNMKIRYEVFIPSFMEGLYQSAEQYFGQRLHMIVSVVWATLEVLRSLLYEHKQEHVTQGCTSFSVTNETPEGQNFMTRFQVLSNEHLNHEKARQGFCLFGRPNKYVDFLHSVYRAHPNVQAYI